MPVLALTGDDDELYAGSQARRAAETLPDAEFVEIPDADHFTLYVRGDLILPHLTAFLARVMAAPISAPDNSSAGFDGVSAELDQYSEADHFRCSGIRVEDPARLNSAIGEALDSGVPFVVDVRTSLAESFQRLTAPLLQSSFQFAWPTCSTATINEGIRGLGRAAREPL
jgi:hypothetical protein